MCKVEKRLSFFTSYYLLLFFIFSSCQSQDICSTQLKNTDQKNCINPLPQIGDSSQEQDDPSSTPPSEDPSDEEGPSFPEESPDGSEIPEDAHLFDADLRFFNFNRTQEEKVIQAVELIKNVVRSSLFRQKVLEYSYQGKNEFLRNNGLSNLEIYELLIKGSEDLLPEEDSRMDLNLQLYYSLSSTVGYTTSNSLTIYLNRRFFDRFDTINVAGNIFHEWTHKLGFSHSKSYTSDRHATVPYALGSIIMDVAAELAP